MFAGLCSLVVAARRLSAILSIFCDWTDLSNPAVGEVHVDLIDVGAGDLDIIFRLAS